MNNLFENRLSGLLVIGGTGLGPIFRAKCTSHPEVKGYKIRGDSLCDGAPPALFYFLPSSGKRNESEIHSAITGSFCDPNHGNLPLQYPQRKQKTLCLALKGHLLLPRASALRIWIMKTTQQILNIGYEWVKEDQREFRERENIYIRYSK